AVRDMTLGLRDDRLGAAPDGGFELGVSAGLDADVGDFENHAVTRWLGAGQSSGGSAGPEEQGFGRAEDPTGWRAAPGFAARPPTGPGAPGLQCVLRVATTIASLVARRACRF